MRAEDVWVDVVGVGDGYDGLAVGGEVDRRGGAEHTLTYVYIYTYIYVYIYIYMYIYIYVYVYT